MGKLVIFNFYESSFILLAEEDSRYLLKVSIKRISFLIFLVYSSLIIFN